MGARRSRAAPGYFPPRWTRLVGTNWLCPVFARPCAAGFEISGGPGLRLARNDLTDQRPLAANGFLAGRYPDQLLRPSIHGEDGRLGTTSRSFLRLRRALYIA